MKTHSEMAVEKFLSGYNCAQAILYAFGPELGLDGDTALRAAAGLGGGMGRRGEVCGAVTGGILALGLKYGRGGQQDRAVTEQAYQKTQAFMAAFERVHGSCTCRTLLSGCDIGTAEGQRYFKENDLFHKTCAKCVKTAGEILAAMLDAPPAQAPAANE
jgi:C_GCAxxG_C_C family probable redox protein